MCCINTNNHLYITLTLTCINSVLEGKTYPGELCPQRLLSSGKYYDNIVQWLHNHRNLSIARWSDICHINFRGKLCRFGKRFHAKGFLFCTYRTIYITYSTIGRSIAFISDLGGIFTSALRASENMSPRVIYWL